MGDRSAGLGAVTVPAFRADRTVKFYESFGLGVSHRGPWAADLLQAATYRIRAASLNRDLHPFCLAAATSPGPSATD
jgi:hypothetical protein